VIGLGAYLVIRIRGRPDVKYDIKETLRRLRLNRKFHATIVPDDPIYKAMLHKVKDYVVYGSVSPELVRSILLKRGRLVGDKPLTEEYVGEALKTSLDDLALRIANGELRLKDIKLLKPVFRLHPPRGGFKRSTKKLVSYGGELGYREDIDRLVSRML
jgi:large subunit ribosomal protein L30